MSIILKNSVALSPFKILMKRSVVTLVIESVWVWMNRVCETKQTCGNLLRRGAPPMSVELFIELLWLTIIFIFSIRGPDRWSLLQPNFRYMKDESRQGTAKVVEAILFTTSKQSLLFWWEHWCGDCHCQAIGRKTCSKMSGLQMQNLCLEGIVRRPVQCSE